jgi:hypothetical protein
MQLRLLVVRCGDISGVDGTGLNVPCAYAWWLVVVGAKLAIYPLGRAPGEILRGVADWLLH